MSIAIRSPNCSASWIKGHQGAPIWCVARETPLVPQHLASTFEEYHKNIFCPTISTTIVQYQPQLFQQDHATKGPKRASEPVAMRRTICLRSPTYKGGTIIKASELLVHYFGLGEGGGGQPHKKNARKRLTWAKHLCFMCYLILIWGMVPPPPPPPTSGYASVLACPLINNNKWNSKSLKNKNSHLFQT